MIAYLITDGNIDIKQEVTLNRETILVLEKAEASKELRFYDESHKIVTVAIKCNIFNPLCVDHRFSLVTGGFKTQHSEITNTTDNSSTMLSRKTGIHRMIKSLKFRALIFYKKHTAYLYLLDDIEAKVVNVWNPSSIEINYHYN